MHPGSEQTWDSTDRSAEWQLSMSSTELSSPFDCAADVAATLPPVFGTAGGSGIAGGGGRAATTPAGGSAEARGAAPASCPMPRKLVGPSPELAGATPGSFGAKPSRVLVGLPPCDGGSSGSGGGAGRRSYGRPMAGSSPRSRGAGLPVIMRRGDEGNEPPPPPPLE